MTDLERSARSQVKHTVDFDEWLRLGIDNGFIGPPVCHTHDGLPTSEVEDTEFDEYGEICVHVLRLYQDAAEKTAVESNHAPSVWRRTNAGY
jgi:hypothetical protein